MVSAQDPEVSNRKSRVLSGSDVFCLYVDRKLRKQLTSGDFRRAARKPWRKLSVKVPQLGDPPRPAATGDQVVILD